MSSMCAGRRIGPWAGAVVAAVGLTATPVLSRGEADHPVLVLLVDRTDDGSKVSDDILISALLLHLNPFDVAVHIEPWLPPTALNDRVDLAHDRTRRAGATVGAWYEIRHQGSTKDRVSSPSVVVHMVRPLSPGQAEHRTLDMGRSAPGIERSMALALRTYICAQRTTTAAPRDRKKAVPARAPGPTTGPPPPPAEPTPHSEDSVFRGRLHLDVHYALDIFPLGLELRHGPSAALVVELRRSLAIGVSAGYRATPDGSDEVARWSRDFFVLTAFFDHSLFNAGRADVALGCYLRVDHVFAAAQGAGDPEPERADLWELAVGVTGEALFRVTRRFLASARLQAGWIPVGHRLEVRGEPAAEPGGLSLSLNIGLRSVLW